jgi:putative NADPH-quinone reductase
LNGAQRIVLLVGSPKTNGGTSGSIGNFILSQLRHDGVTLETHHVGRAVRRAEKWDLLVGAVDDADIVVLSFPLYWDSLPSHLIEAMERLHAHRKSVEIKNAPKLYVVVNNGFPETWHNEVAISMCRYFAKEAGFRWHGALNIAGGGAIDERPLEATGGMTLRLRETLKMAAVAIGEGEPTPKEVEARLEKQLYPSWVISFANFRWKREAKKRGVKDPLCARPYEQH